MKELQDLNGLTIASNGRPGPDAAGVALAATKRMQGYLVHQKMPTPGTLP